MFKIKKDLVPTPIKELFPTYDDVYNLRNQRCWKSSNVSTVKFGTENLLYRGQKTWQLLPDLIRNSETLGEFKSKIKKLGSS